LCREEGELVLGREDFDPARRAFRPRQPRSSRSTSARSLLSRWAARSAAPRRVPRHLGSQGERIPRQVGFGRAGMDRCRRQDHEESAQQHAAPSLSCAPRAGTLSRSRFCPACSRRS
jgi:hypothetical protein